jgi:uncharacterized damage-inducible protein DinB
MPEDDALFRVSEHQQPEPWLRNTLATVPAIPRAVLHALELARENVEHWTPLLTDEEIHAQPFGLTPYAFHVRHIAHSLDRLLTYAEGEPLNVIQLSALNVELEPGMTREAMLAEFSQALREAAGRIRALPLEQIEQPRLVGGKRLPATLGGLLVHLADHTQRHAGQAVTTAKLLVAMRA